MDSVLDARGALRPLGALARVCACALCGPGPVLHALLHDRQEHAEGDDNHKDPAPAAAAAHRVSRRASVNQIANPRLVPLQKRHFAAFGRRGVRPIHNIITTTRAERRSGGMQHAVQSLHAPAAIARQPRSVQATQRMVSADGALVVGDMLHAVHTRLAEEPRLRMARRRRSRSHACAVRQIAQ